MDGDEKRRHEDRQQEDHDLLVELRTDMKAVGKSLEKIWEKLDAQGDVRKDLDNHKRDHKWFVTILLSAAAILGGIVGWIFSKK